MMAKKPANSALTIPILPQFETRARRPLFDGLWPGIDDSMWLWRSVPMGSVPDARTEEGAVAVGHGLANAYEALAAFAGSGAHRSQVKSTYRDTHALLLNVPTTFKANPKSPIADELNREYGDRPTIQRVLLFGVRLKATTGNGTLKSAVDSVWETLRYGGSPLSDYEKDHRDMAMVFSRAGFSVPTLQELHLADSWWNYGLAKGVPVLLHDEHIHFFHSAAEARAAVDINRLDCRDWPEAIGEHAISFAAVESFDLDFTPATDAKARWVIPLLESGARVISIRAKVEPSKVTRNELRGQQRRYRADLSELQAQGKMDRAELEEREAQLTSIERAYANGGPATLMDTSVIVGFSGVIDDIDKFSPPGAELSPMLNRQGTAWHETMANSAVRANPLQHDLPQTTISYSALPTLTRIGDADGAMIGFTEDDRQPAYLSPVAAADEDTLPFLYVLAATRAGKTMLLQNIAHQFNRLQHPQVIIDFKKNSDLSDMVRYSGGQTISLDDMVSADGPLDPVRIFPDRADAIAKATSMIHRVNPYHDSRVDAYANDISFAISWGIENGAKATGQALMMAAKAGLIEQKIIDPIFKHAQVYPMFRATFGIEPHTQALNLADGLTLVRSGATQVELPPMGMDPADLPRAEPAVRNSLNVIRMLVWGSLASLSSRRGVLHFDESWMLEKASPSDLDEVGRLCGQWGVFPIFYNQRPSGPLKIGLKGYISRFLIGHIKDEEEASAALQLANIDNPRALERITAERYHGDGGGLNWDSLQHLPDGSGGVARGSVFYYADLRNRLATVEHRPSDEFLRLGDQSPEGISRRKREKEEALLALR